MQTNTAKSKAGRKREPYPIGQILQCAREIRGVKRDELSSESGVGWGTIRDLEEGRREPKRETIEALVEALKKYEPVSLDDLIK